MLRFYYIRVKQLKEKSHMQYGNMHFPIGNPKKMNDTLKLISIQEEQCLTFHNTSATITIMCSPRNGNNSPKRLSILSRDHQEFSRGGYHLSPWKGNSSLGHMSCSSQCPIKFLIDKVFPEWIYNHSPRTHNIMFSPRSSYFKLKS